MTADSLIIVLAQKKGRMFFYLIIMKEKEMECVYPHSPNMNFLEIISADIQNFILNAICVGFMLS